MCFSRLTSGIVSPSELPDSPTQTVPPSPKPRKGIDYASNKPSILPRTAGDGRPQPAPRNIPKPISVFEDNVTKFKEESTPVQFSTTTSLSSLTIDDKEESCVIDNVSVNGKIFTKYLYYFLSGRSDSTIIRTRFSNGIGRFRNHRRRKWLRTEKHVTTRR